MSKFIVIEGPDRVGKATQVKLLQKKLVEKNKTVATVEVPLRSNPVYHLIYWMLGNGLAKKFPKIFQWLQYANRQIFQWTILPRLESECDYIIMDRWSLSTVVYGAATGVSEAFTKKLCDRLRRPDHTIVLYGAAHRHEAEDTYESDERLQARVSDLYRLWAAENTIDSLGIDCSLPKDEITDLIFASLHDKKLLEESR
jgi:dTMP kinase